MKILPGLLSCDIVAAREHGRQVWRPGLGSRWEPGLGVEGSDE